MFKNWPEICRIGKESQLLMALLVALEIPSRIAERMQLAFPECFSEIETSVRIPLSVVEERARVIKAIEEDSLHYFIYDALRELEVPAFMFSVGAQAKMLSRMEEFPEGYLLLPKEIDPRIDVGSVVEWVGKKFYVIIAFPGDHGGEGGDVCLVPVECIDLNV